MTDPALTPSGSVATPGKGKPCGHCGRPIAHLRRGQRFCRSTCRTRAWDALHPRPVWEVRDWEQAKRRRDAALAQVEESGGAWGDLAMAALVRLCRGLRQAPWETYKAALLTGGLEAPHHYNAWGALVRRAVRAGLLVRVGYTTATTPASHGTEARVYRVVG